MSQPLKKIAIVGASGRIGGYIAKALVKNGKQTVTALTRAESKGTLPEGIVPVKVDFSDGASLESALKGQQVLIITLGVTAPPDLHDRIVAAAATAGVPYIMPNNWGFDVTSPSYQTDMFGKQAWQNMQSITATGVSAAIALVCGRWYEWSLAIGEHAFGFDIKNKKVTFYDDGKYKINSSTWDLCGEAVAALFSQPESIVAEFKNNVLRISSFTVSQRDILDSLHRVMGTTDADWSISFQSSQERFQEGLAELQKGNQVGFVKAMYAKGFFPGGDGNFSDKGLQNERFHLPAEDLDTSTKRAVDMVQSGWNPWA
ncbi:putative oxidoreductase - protein [Phaeoacremonium minimum UCRPA7]|uniref:Putative oxidoreductase-protein n=1 Tax=Phaeoacremonium minimum (strain UCR-PA7) TaxID=1286976 RepID=R8BQC6_PHAM7|nr:putative oxidoreductase - protein [Phaeoacremonium minimum UCRPA7]EOO01552.1 putative oxidoreductase - protein [Phaeoacremonium minimum UCRPA7]